MTANDYQTKKEAFQAARTLRDQGHTVTIYRRSGVYTQPGRGIVAFVQYTVVAVN